MLDFDTNWPVPYINAALCNGCGMCVKACPNRALALEDEKAFVAFPLDCEYCGDCERLCPLRAISRAFLLVS